MVREGRVTMSTPKSRPTLRPMNYPKCSVYPLSPLLAYVAGRLRCSASRCLQCDDKYAVRCAIRIAPCTSPYRRKISTPVCAARLRRSRTQRKRPLDLDATARGHGQPYRVVLEGCVTQRCHQQTSRSLTMFRPIRCQLGGWHAY